MLKKITFILFFISNAFSLEVSKSENFKTDIFPKQKQTSFSLELRHPNSNLIEEKFQKAILYAKKSSICRGGQYNIRPYRNVIDKRVNEGYSSYINFTCKFKNNKQYERVLNKIKTLDMKLTQNRINYMPSPKEKNMAKEKLETRAFNYAKKYKNRLNKYFKKCKIKNISFNSNHYQPMNTYGREMDFRAAKSTTVSAPIDNKVQYSLNVNYIFTCN